MMIKKTTLSGRARARLEVVLVGVLERSFRVLGWFDTRSADVREIMCGGGWRGIFPIFCYLFF